MTQDELKQRLHYDPLTGLFTNLRTGKVTGTLMKSGYLQIRVMSKLYYAHQLAWFYLYGIWLDFIDHEDNDRQNNCKLNLRAATQAQNNKNSSMNRNNTSGFKGVSFSKQKNKWQATITVESKHKSLGFHIKAEDAALAYDAAALHHYGKFAKTNKMLGLLQ